MDSARASEKNRAKYPAGEEERHLKEELHKIEWLLKKSVEKERDGNPPYNPAYGNITDLNTCRIIMDSVSQDTLRILTQDCIDLLDTSIAIYEKNGDYAFGMFVSGWCKLLDTAGWKLCGTDNTRKALVCGRWHCHENCWHESAKPTFQRREATDIECVGGIHLYAVPIWASDEVVGVINMGYGDPPTDDDTLAELADKFNIRVEELQKEADTYLSRPKFIIDVAKRRLETAAKLIGGIVERKQFERRLEKEIGKRKKIEMELRANMEDLEHFSKLAVDREEQMIRLKEEVNRLTLERGGEKKYHIVR
jgi:hypothetical protein